MSRRTKPKKVMTPEQVFLSTIDMDAIVNFERFFEFSSPKEEDENYRFFDDLRACILEFDREISRKELVE